MAQIGVQIPLMTTQDDRGPNSSAQSASWLQKLQRSSGREVSSCEKSAQKAALPVVTVQRQAELFGLQVTAAPTEQVSASAKQTPAL
jgi:hypothetical protein